MNLGGRLKKEREKETGPRFMLLKKLILRMQYYRTTREAFEIPILKP